MKEFIKRYLSYAVAIIGLALFAYYGWKTIQLGSNPPEEPPSISQGIGDQSIETAKSAYETQRVQWNNQFARQGFFGLVGVFLFLLATVPKKLQWIPKVLFSSGLVALIIHHLLADGKIASIAREGFEISIFWIFMAFVVKGTGMGCTIWRWKILLDGQGFRIPLRHLIESFLIGRFIGSFAPGTSGLDGYRAYDISRYTGKVARSISVIFVEKLIGFFVLGTLALISVPVGRSLFQSREVNTTALIVMGLLFSGMMLASMLVLFKPQLIRWVVGKFIPKASPLSKPFNKAIRAVSAYEKRKLYLIKATLVGFGVHLGTIGMYFCTSRAIGLSPDSSHLFVTGALMICATVLPLSIAGIGMREGVFVFFMGPIAAIYAFGGYLVGELISLLGGPVWLARRADYYEVIKTQREAINRDVDDDDALEEMESDQAAASSEPSGPLPSVKRYAALGLAAGLVAGLAVAIVDAIRLFTLAGSVNDYSLLGYAALVYGPLLAVIGGTSAISLALLNRLVMKPAAPDGKVSTFLGGALFFVFVLAIGFFYLYRDVFEEKAGLFSPQLLGYLAALAGTALVLVLATVKLLRVLFNRFESLAQARVAVGLYVVITGILIAAWAFAPSPKGSSRPVAAQEGDSNRPNVLLVMVDTLRADHVGVYGRDPTLTPHTDALAQDGVVYQNTFAQASWTRPSVATILTGRYPSSHTAVFKGSVLPDELTTVAEVFRDSGYETLGVATNYNLTPFFNFDQGFHDYEYLSPNLPLFATDTQAKLIAVEILKKILAKLRKGKTETPADYYAEGEIVTEKALAKLDGRSPKHPFFMFVTYMDPHDPYFRHPFDGHGISHRANPKPEISLADEMRDLYQGEVAYWDQCFGALIGGLKERGLYENTLIVVVSDHGEEFGEHGGFWHGTTLYDEQLKVVFIAKYPADMGIGGGVKINDWMRLLDVAPLILETTGQKIPKEMQGSPAPASAFTPIFAEEDHQGNILKSIRYNHEGEERKLIEANPNNPRGLPDFELFKTAEDTQEKNNIWNPDEDRAKSSLKMLRQYEQTAQKGAATAVTGALSGEATKQLKNLGYIE